MRSHTKIIIAFTAMLCIEVIPIMSQDIKTVKGKIIRLDKKNKTVPFSTKDSLHIFTYQHETDAQEATAQFYRCNHFDEITTIPNPTSRYTVDASGRYKIAITKNQYFLFHTPAGDTIYYADEKDEINPIISSSAMPPSSFQPAERSYLDDGSYMEECYWEYSQIEIDLDKAETYVQTIFALPEKFCKPNYRIVIQPYYLHKEDSIFTPPLIINGTKYKRNKTFYLLNRWQKKYTYPIPLNETNRLIVFNANIYHPAYPQLKSEQSPEGYLISVDNSKKMICQTNIYIYVTAIKYVQNLKELWEKYHGKNSE